MTPQEAFALWRRWYGTAERRKPPTDNDLRRWLAVTRETWDAAAVIVQTERAKVDGHSVFWRCCRR